VLGQMIAVLESEGSHVASVSVPERMRERLPASDRQEPERD